MTVRTNRAWHLASRPQGLIKRSDFDWRETPVPALAEGQALARTIYLSLDPTNRIWASDIDQYMPPVRLGDVMRGVALGQIVDSRRGDLKAGDLVYGLLGWQDYTVIDQPGTVSKFTRIPGLPLGTTLSLLGLALKAVHLLTGAHWAAQWLHALTIGTAAMMILAVMTRASLGHTGRPLVVARNIAVAYALLLGAALVRVFGPALLPASYLAGVESAALLWIAAFAIHVVVYAPILTRERADGKPG